MNMNKSGFGEELEQKFDFGCMGRRFEDDGSTRRLDSQFLQEVEEGLFPAINFWMRLRRQNPCSADSHLAVGGKDKPLYRGKDHQI